MCEVDGNALADWLSAIGTVGAVGWGVWLVRRDAREKRAQRKSDVHEIASGAEKAAVTWDKLAAQFQSTGVGLSRDEARSWMYQAQEEAETIERLLNRDNLTDGTIHCGVSARQLAARLMDLLKACAEEKLDGPQLSKRILELRERAQNVLEAARRLRNYYAITPPRVPHRYSVLSLPAVLPPRS